jgi:hypothetical protein
MPYADFSLASLKAVLGVTADKAPLFDGIEPLPVPAWLESLIARGRRQILQSEKARSEFIVVPILLACQELTSRSIAIFSGQRLDVDPEHGLIGECDFILAASPLVPELQAPLVTIVEAKNDNVEGGVWQCIAQMVGASVFNERSGLEPRSVFGCVTNGEAWQFLRLTDRTALIDSQRYYIDDVGSILAAFKAIFDDELVPA